MGIVRGDRIAESRKLNRRSVAAQDFYALLVSKVPDDFGRFRLAVVLIAGALYPRREPTPGHLKRIRRLLDELGTTLQDGGPGAGPLWKSWECDGVIFGELETFRPTGNRYHRTPEPPWSEHDHHGACATTALHQARSFGLDSDAATIESFLQCLRARRNTPETGRNGSDSDRNTLETGRNEAELKREQQGMHVNELRERRRTGEREERVPGGGTSAYRDGGHTSPSSPSSPTSPSTTTGDGRAAAVLAPPRSGNGSEPAAAPRGEAVRSGVRHDPERPDQVALIERAEEVARVSRAVLEEPEGPDDVRLALEAATTTAGEVSITNGRITSMGPKWVQATMDALDRMEADYQVDPETQTHDPPEDAG